ncbi:tol-pal system protein YbgF [Granulosicoccus antarcticus]|uniref:Cell division coordinator CpoB n=1 Tax=Granulosicoccus antarcticus IMCC3135 TaxID=1192854 RepID=A0A2Z2P6T3_9GAMM|nr:tol-pal system protein YbgF [Granulosicoccus antarcticus]ASJ75564.1 Outer membrane protein assembly factor BamD [Granulosicoccus antarcticus IMCC3135]
MNHKNISSFQPLQQLQLRAARPASRRLCTKALALACTCLLLAAKPVLAQEKPTLDKLDSRLARIERVMDQSLLDQLQRIDGLQKEIRGLRGEIENLNYDIQTLTKRNSDLYADTDRRITDLEEAQDSLGLLGGEGGLAGSGLLDETAGGLDETAATSAEVPAGVFVSEEGVSIPYSNDADFGDGPRPPGGKLRDTATQAEKAGYTRAYDLLARGQNDSAVASFDDFLKKFPDGPYSDNAWYWQGEAMYAQRSFEEALRNFGVVVNSFSNSTKVPDARLKIGFALYEQGEYEQARSILTGVQDDYPGRSAAVLARKRLQKMDREGL